MRPIMLQLHVERYGAIPIIIQDGVQAQQLLNQWANKTLPPMLVGTTVDGFAYGIDTTKIVAIFYKDLETFQREQMGQSTTNQQPWGGRGGSGLK